MHGSWRLTPFTPPIHTRNLADTCPDPKTQAFLRNHIDPVFGYRGIVRFSWATVKVLLEKQAASCTWADDVTQPSAAAYFGDSAKSSKLYRDLGISGVGEL